MQKSVRIFTQRKAVTKSHILFLRPLLVLFSTSEPDYVPSFHLWSDSLHEKINFIRIYGHRVDKSRVIWVPRFRMVKV